jgi:hypothetical protein
MSIIGEDVPWAEVWLSMAACGFEARPASAGKLRHTPY